MKQNIMDGFGIGSLNYKKVSELKTKKKLIFSFLKAFSAKTHNTYNCKNQQIKKKKNFFEKLKKKF